MLTSLFAGIFIGAVGTTIHKALSPQSRDPEHLFGPAEELTKIQQAAVIFMSLPPEISASLFSELDPVEVQSVTLTITELPTINYRTRLEAVDNFCQRAGFEIGNFEKAVKDDTKKAAAILAGMTSDLTQVQKVTLLLQSWPSTLAQSVRQELSPAVCKELPARIQLEASESESQLSIARKQFFDLLEMPAEEASVQQHPKRAAAALLKMLLS